MASKYKYKFTAKAKQDLDDILNYIIKNLKSPDAAKNLLEKLIFICCVPQNSIPKWCGREKWRYYGNLNWQ